MPHFSLAIRLSVLISLTLAHAPVVMAGQCPEIAPSAAQKASTDQCSTPAGPVRMADAGEQASCRSQCIEVFSSCNTSRARDCVQEYKICSWSC